MCFGQGPSGRHGRTVSRGELAARLKKFGSGEESPDHTSRYQRDQITNCLTDALEKANRGDAVREWNGRMQQYRQDEYKRQFQQVAA